MDGKKPQSAWRLVVCVGLAAHALDFLQAFKFLKECKA
jgi:hypothetical protein